VSNVHRLRVSNRIFFISVNLRRAVGAFRDTEYPLLIGALQGARQRLGFLLCGYVLMPDHWHALLWTKYPLTISQVIHDIKKVSARRLNQGRWTEGPVWQHQKNAHGQKKPDRGYPLQDHAISFLIQAAPAKLAVAEGEAGAEGLRHPAVTKRTVRPGPTGRAWAFPTGCLLATRRSAVC